MESTYIKLYKSLLLKDIDVKFHFQNVEPLGNRRHNSTEDSFIHEVIVLS